MQVFPSGLRAGKKSACSYFCLVLIFLTASITIASAQVPVISSFSPTSGPVGTTVTITGTNFDPVAGNNTVYFGAVKATVTAAAGTSLAVTAPAGATYQPITVTRNGLTAYSAKSFIVTFPSVGARFTSSSFGGAVNYSTGGPSANGLALNDLDGDGKGDMIVVNYAGTSSTIATYRNVSSFGTFAWFRKDFPVNSNAFNTCVADIDGDGKLDIATANWVDSTVSIFRNTSTIGNISFAAATNFKTGGSAFNLAAGDLDGDGRPDIAVVSEISNGVLILRNLSSAGSITFAPQIIYPTASNARGVAIGDLDGDGRPELVLANESLNSLSILPNVSTSGEIAFGTKIDFETGLKPQNVAIGDLDNDGKPDLAVGNLNSYTVSVFRNSSSNGIISFASKSDYSIAYSSFRGLAISDVDGDGKVDLAVSTDRFNAIFRNVSSEGTIALAEAYDLSGGGGQIVAGDLDGDNKPDIASTNIYGPGLISIYRNQISCPNTTFLNNAQTVSDANCGYNDGRITILPATGVAPYKYSINGGNSYTDGSNTGYVFNNLPAATYQLRLNDASGCESEIVERIVKSVNCVKPTLYGTTQYGGSNNNGVLFSINAPSGTYTKLKDFTGPDGANPFSGLVQHPNGKLFGVTANGGTNGQGVIFSFDTSTYTYTKVKDFSGADGANSLGSLIKASDNKVYGMTGSGGSNNSGVIFSFDPSSNTYAKLKDFTSVGNTWPDGKSPYGSLVQASNGKLYGMTSGGGSNGYYYGEKGYYNEGYGAIFSFDPTSNTYQKVKDFTGVDGKNPSGSLVQATNGKLYGMTGSGGTNNAGVIFSVDPSSNVYTVEKSFSQFEERSPQGSLIQASNGKLYGFTTSGGGSNYKGVLFSFDPSSSTYSKLVDLEAQTLGDLMQASDGKLYGFGGNGFSSNASGLIFSYDPTSNTYIKLKDVTGTEGGYQSFGALIELVTNPTTCTPPTFKNDGTIVLDASCANNDGNISIIPTSGNAPFMYSKDGGVTYVSGADAGSGFMGLSAGMYKLRLKDAKGCESAIVEREIKLNCATTCTPPTFKNDGTIVLDASCANNDGNISIIPTSGNSPFMYSKDGGVTYVSGADAGSGFMGLSAGMYKLRLKDAKGCESAIVEREIKLNCVTTCTPPTFLNGLTIVLNASCANNDGNITIEPTSGTGPFMYSINGGTTYISGPNYGYTFANLAAGNYQLRLKDVLGCESAVVDRTVLLNCGTCTPPTFKNDLTIVLNPSCANNDGLITIEPTSGTGPFMYSKDGGTTYVSGPNYGYSFGNLSAGTYWLRLKDATGCESAIVEKKLSVMSGIPCAQTSAAAVVTAIGMALPTDAISAYPNPTKGQFKLQLKGFTSSKAEVSIFNGEGKLVQKRQLNVAGTNTVDFDLTGRAKGMYYIKITSNSGTRTSKVLVQ